jgi:hypothetical protein
MGSSPVNFSSKVWRIPFIRALRRLDIVPSYRWDMFSRRYERYDTSFRYPARDGMISCSPGEARPRTGKLPPGK